MSSPETPVDSFETGCNTRSGTQSQRVTERDVAAGETKVVAMYNVPPPRMIHLDGRSCPPNPPLRAASTLLSLAENCWLLSSSLSAKVMACLSRRSISLPLMCYRPYDRYLCGHRVYRPWVIHCRAGPCPNGDSWPKRQDWYLQILCRECGRRRLHKSTRQAQ